jgi:hypothetical protein
MKPHRKRLRRLAVLLGVSEGRFGCLARCPLPIAPGGAIVVSDCGENCCTTSSQSNFGPMRLCHSRAARQKIRILLSSNSSPWCDRPPPEARLMLQPILLLDDPCWGRRERRRVNGRVCIGAGSPISRPPSANTGPTRAHDAGTLVRRMENAIGASAAARPIGSKRRSGRG